MGYVGTKPSAVPLTSADITDGIITSAKIADGTIVNADINASAAIDSTKLSGVQGKFESQLFHVRDEKASGTNGGTPAVTTFTKRTLNTVMTNEISDASLSSDVITLPSGTYFVYGSMPFHSAGVIKSRLRNTTDSTNSLIGTNNYGNAGTLSIISGRFTISAQKNFEFQYYVGEQNGTISLGYGASSGITEVFADVQIWKVA